MIHDRALVVTLLPLMIHDRVVKLKILLLPLMIHWLVIPLQLPLVIRWVVMIDRVIHHTVAMLLVSIPLVSSVPLVSIPFFPAVMTMVISVRILRHGIETEEKESKKGACSVSFCATSVKN